MNGMGVAAVTLAFTLAAIVVASVVTVNIINDVWPKGPGE